MNIGNDPLVILSEKEKENTTIERLEINELPKDGDNLVDSQLNHNNCVTIEKLASPDEKNAKKLRSPRP